MVAVCVHVSDEPIGIEIVCKWTMVVRLSLVSKVAM